MHRRIPVNLLIILENLFSTCWSCVKWKSATSKSYRIEFGLRQGSILSPYIFACYVDDVVSHLNYRQRYSIVLYADDILLLAPSVCELQRLLDACERELDWLDMDINTKKSCCMRIGPRCDAECANITTSSGYTLPWVEEIRYLGIFFTKSCKFKISLEHAKRSCYKSLNSIFGKIGRLHPRR